MDISGTLPQTQDLSSASEVLYEQSCSSRETHEVGCHGCLNAGSLAFCAFAPCEKKRNQDQSPIRSLIHAPGYYIHCPLSTSLIIPPHFLGTSASALHVYQQLTARPALCELAIPNLPTVVATRITTHTTVILLHAKKRSGCTSCPVVHQTQSCPGFQLKSNLQDDEQLCTSIDRKSKCSQRSQLKQKTKPQANQQFILLGPLYQKTPVCATVDTVTVAFGSQVRTHNWFWSETWGTGNKSSFLLIRRSILSTGPFRSLHLYSQHFRRWRGMADWLPRRLL